MGGGRAQLGEEGERGVAVRVEEGGLGEGADNLLRGRLGVGEKPVRRKRGDE